MRWAKKYFFQNLTAPLLFKFLVISKLICIADMPSKKVHVCNFAHIACFHFFKKWYINCLMFNCFWLSKNCVVSLTLWQVTNHFFGYETYSKFMLSENHCCGTVTIFCGSSSDFWKVMVPVRALTIERLQFRFWYGFRLMKSYGSSYGSGSVFRS